MLTSGARWSGRQPHDGHRDQPWEDASPRSCLFFFHPFLSVHLLQSLCRSRNSEKNSLRHKARGLASWGHGVHPSASRTLSSHPRAGKGSEVHARACTLSPRGLCTVCSFCQNACPHTPTCSAEQASQTPPQRGFCEPALGLLTPPPPDPLLPLLGTRQDWTVSQGSGCSYFPVLPHRGQEAEHQHLVEYALNG